MSVVVLETSNANVNMTDELLDRFSASDSPTPEDPHVVWTDERAQMLEFRGQVQSIALPYSKLEWATHSEALGITLSYGPLFDTPRTEKTAPVHFIIGGKNLERLFRGILSQRVKCIVLQDPVRTAPPPPDGIIVKKVAHWFNPPEPLGEHTPLNQVKT